MPTWCSRVAPTLMLDEYGELKYRVRQPAAQPYRGRATAEPRTKWQDRLDYPVAQRLSQRRPRPVIAAGVVPQSCGRMATASREVIADVASANAAPATPTRCGHDVRSTRRTPAHLQRRLRRLPAAAADYADRTQRHMLIDFGSTEIAGRRSRVAHARHRRRHQPAPARASWTLWWPPTGMPTTSTGFGARATGDHRRVLQPEVVVQPWTEHPDLDPDAATPVTGAQSAGDRALAGHVDEHAGVRRGGGLRSRTARRP